MNLTQVEMAERLGTSPSTISRWETGEIGLLVEDILRIAEEFKVPVAPLLAEYANLSVVPLPHVVLVIHFYQEAAYGDVLRFLGKYQSDTLIIKETHKT